PPPSTLGRDFVFFQAEDGIRVFHVTGVQTCALPISAGRRRSSSTRTWPARRAVPAAPSTGRGFRASSRSRLSCPADSTPETWLRSEERRIGKECRSRWWRCQYKRREGEQRG